MEGHISRSTRHDAWVRVRTHWHCICDVMRCTCSGRAPAWERRSAGPCPYRDARAALHLVACACQGACLDEHVRACGITKLPV